ncbi:MAG: DUF86 domain-containing protein [Methanoculleus sp.]|mgnify:CR=1 FL=1|nr:DUF86 domain-containing protein [Methanomicrobiales archaeon]NQS73464.1 DUF86 domain-containing protein [Methanoculleus sp.]
MSDGRLYLIHIAESIEKIEDYTRDGRDGFMNSPMAQDAVVRNFEIIGEAVKQIPGSLKEKRPDIPWRRVAGLRDVLIHQYMSVDLEAVWAIVEEELPKLKHAVTEILAGVQDR